jgi:site-specific DNA-cytosine methylase
VFVVGHLGDVKRPAKVLFESQSLCRNSTPSREKREGATRAFASSVAGNLYTQCGVEKSKHQTIANGNIVREWQSPNGKEIVGSVLARDWKGIGNQDLTEGRGLVVAFDSYNNSVTGDVSKTLDTGQDYHHVPNVFQKKNVRRLTPKECERLQGFPDDYTRIPWNGKSADKCPDGPRYKALGNSMATNCMEWIGKRITEIDTRP